METLYWFYVHGADKGNAMSNQVEGLEAVVSKWPAGSYEVRMGLNGRESVVRWGIALVDRGAAVRFIPDAAQTT